MQYAGVLIENGDADEAVRQLTEALRFDGGNAVAHSLLARAYLDKGVWQKCLEASSKALDLDAANATANLWRADCLRQLGDSEQSTARFAAAAESYRRFLSLTNFSTPVYQWFAYHFIGFHLGGIAHPDRKASYENLRAAGFLGLCICERRTGSPLRAREHCRRALRYEPNDPIAHFVMGLAQLGAFEKTRECADFDSARASFVTMLNINPKLAEAKHARHYIDEIDGRRIEIRKRGCS